jgi:HSP20 family protein
VLLTSFDPFVQEFDRLTQRVFGGAGGAAGWQSVMPMDAIRREDGMILRFDLPGVDPESIDLTVDKGVLTVTAQRPDEHGEGDQWITHERMTGTFTRRVYLAEMLDFDHIDASYHNGVLAVRLPLHEKARPRKVEIKTDGLKKITA